MNQGNKSVESACVSFVCSECHTEFYYHSKNGVCRNCLTKMRDEFIRDNGRKPKPEELLPSSKNANSESGSVKTKRRKVSRCKFCGGVAVNNTFCSECIANGFNDVYAFTGKSNGWDKPKHVKVPVKSGWRGRVCSGGGMALSSLAY